MHVPVNRVIEHVLAIVNGHTGLSFLAVKNPLGRGETNEHKSYTLTWTSEPIDITGGTMGMLTRTVRLRIVMSAMMLYDDDNPSATEELPVTNQNGDFPVSATFLFMSPTGAETAMNRQIQFRGHYFRRFD